MNSSSILDDLLINNCQLITSTYEDILGMNDQANVEEADNQHDQGSSYCNDLLLLDPFVADDFLSNNGSFLAEQIPIGQDALFVSPSALTGPDHETINSAAYNTRHILEEQLLYNHNSGVNTLKRSLSSPTTLEEAVLKRARQTNSVEPRQPTFVAHVAQTSFGSRVLRVSNKYAFEDTPLMKRFHSTQLPMLLTQTPENGAKNSLSKQEVEKYLKEECNDTVVEIHCPRIGQKSYGNEKRFFCPPPIVQVRNVRGDFGGVITVSPDPTGTHYQQHCGGTPTITVENENENSVSFVFKNMFVGDLQRIKDRAPMPNNSFRSQRLYESFSALGKSRISKREFEFYAKIENLGTFSSDVITLISKPSKKKVFKSDCDKVQVVPTETITKDSFVALFNRLKSQNISTRYLKQTQGNRLEGDASVWHPFAIRAIDKEQCRINFDTHIYLERESWRSEPLIIRRVETKTCTILPSSDVNNQSEQEPVFQLQKVAFERASKQGQFLFIDSETSEISFRDSKRVECTLREDDDVNVFISDKIDDYSIWSMVCVSSLSYRFSADSSLFVSQLPKSPVPKVYNCKLLDYPNDEFLFTIIVSIPSHSLLELFDAANIDHPINEALASLFEIFIGEFKCQILKSIVHDNSNTSLTFDVQYLCRPFDFHISDMPYKQLPLLMVRTLDLVIYNTDCMFDCI